MSQSYSLSVEIEASPADIQLIHKGLGAYNRQFAQDADFRPVHIFARNVAGEIIGGLLGNLYWGWLAVDVLWVAETMRQHGIGSALLTEDEARKASILRVHLDTMGFQALSFYQKHGYRVWGQLDNFVNGHTRYYLKKALNLS